MSLSHRIPLRISLPASVIVVGALLSGIFLMWSNHDAERRLRDEVSLLLLDKAQELSTGLEEIGPGNDAEIQREFSLRTRQPRLQTATILDADYRVLLARQNDWRGRAIASLEVGFDQQLAQLALRSGTPQFAADASGYRYSLYLALPLAHLREDGRQPQLGLLWLKLDAHDVYRQVRNDTRLRALVLILTLIGIAGVLWWLLYRRVGMRLRHLSSAADAVARGHLQQRVHVNGSDEIARLARSFNHMAESLAQAELLRQSQQNELQRSEQRYRSLFESSKDFIAIFDLQLRHTDANPAYLQMLGYTLEELRGLGYADVAEDATNPRQWQQLQQELLGRGFSDEFEKTFIRKDGSHCPVSIKAILMRDASGKPSGFWGIGRDMSSRKKTQAALKLAGKVYAASHEGIIVTDPERLILTANPAYSEITGYPPSETVGYKPRFLLSGQYDETFYEELLLTVTHDGFWQGEIIGRRKNGELYPVWVTVTAAFEAGQLVNYIITFSDITERKQTEDHIRHLAEHDFLTDLPNRVLLLDRLSQTLVQSRRNANRFALLFIDLDRFKHINDTLGHHIGDLLLQEVAQRLKQTLRDSDTVSRQGGDEFVILLPDASNSDELNHLTTRLMQALTQPYRLETHEFSVTASIGIAIYPDDGEDIDTLVRNADTAMYHAKQHGRNRFQFFNESMNARISQRLLLESRLRKAMQQGQLQLYFQPKVEVGSTRIVGAEALLRWLDPDEGMINPSRFIPVAEESGLIVELGEWVLHSACRQAREWQDRGLPGLVVSVNVSAVQFRQPNLAQVVAQALQSADLAGEYLELELTEGMLMEQPASASATMAALKAMGVRLALDDFGTGYSSLSYLKRYPFDTLKIDQSFIRDLCQDGEDDSLVKTIILMAKNLNLRAVAEGVETQQQLDFLSANECDEFQGFLRSQALPANDFERLLRMQPD